MKVNLFEEKAVSRFWDLWDQSAIKSFFSSVFDALILQNKRINPSRTNISLLFLVLLFGTSTAFAQSSDTLKTNLKELQASLDTVKQDSLIKPQKLPYQLSKDALEAKVERISEDSSVNYVGQNRAALYGNAKVSFQEINLSAGIIELDYDKELIFARPIPDSSGSLVNFPNFSDGTQEFTADSILYNYKSGKGKVYNMRSQQEDIYIIGTETKFIRAQGPDTTQNDIVNTKSALFTTCTAEHPHFGIRSNKVKIVPNKLAVIGPSNLEIMGIPTPAWFPFGFIPLKQGRRTGLIFPNDYEYSPQLGFGLRGVGWFFPIGDHLNMSITSNIYLKGSFGLNVNSNYNKRYKYSGSLNVGFDSRVIENVSDGTTSRSNAYNLRFSHRQDRRAHPTNTFGGSVNIQTNGFQSRVFNDANNVLAAQLNSNLNFSKTWEDKPISLSAGLTHSQNTQNNQMTITLPNVRFLTQSIYPFRKPGGKETWYENTVVQYSGELRNRIQTIDSLLFEPETLESAQFGVQHRVNLSNSFKFLKNFNFNPSANYEEVWYLKTIDKNFDENLVFEVDTIFNADGTAFNLDTTILDYGTVNTDTLTGFASYRTFSMGAAVNTRLFFTYENSKGFLRGVRWEMRPSVSFNYSPNYLERDYFRQVQTDTRFPDEFDTFSIFDGNIFGSPPRQEEQMAIGYSLNNIFQAKTFSKKDSTINKVKLIDNVVINGRYNFAADSLKWSTISMRTTTRLFKGATTVGFQSTFDPYKQDANGRRINEWTGFRGILPFRFDNAILRFNTNLTVSKIRALFQGQEEEVITDVRQQRNQPRSLAEGQDFLSLFENFRIAHNVVFRWDVDNTGKTKFQTTTNAVNFQGTVQLTENWGVNIGNFGYDFVRNGLSYPSLGLTRDLHCWQMTFDWAPTRGTYNFTIAVKPGSLEFLRLPYQRNNYDTFNNAF